MLRLRAGQLPELPWGVVPAVLVPAVRAVPGALVPPSSTPRKTNSSLTHLFSESRPALAHVSTARLQPCLACSCMSVPMLPAHRGMGMSPVGPTSYSDFSCLIT